MRRLRFVEMMFSLVEAIAKCKGARRAFFTEKHSTVTAPLLGTPRPDEYSDGC